MSIFVNEWAFNIFQVNRENYKIHFIWFRILFFLLLMMSLNRVVLFVSFDSELPDLSLSHVSAFWMGLRFDALILGFSYFVVLILGVLRFFFPEEITRHGMIYLTKKYYLLVWILISVIYYFNTWFVLTHQRHMRLPDWQRAVELKTYMVAQNFSKEVFLMITGALVVSFYFGAYKILKTDEFYDVDIEKKVEFPEIVSKNETLRELYTMKQNLPDVTPYWLQFYFYLLIPLIIAALFARGTVTNHHLGLQHSVISSHTLMNELVLNPVWTFDKAQQ
ncbi:MAG: hypothetical protein ACK5P5_01910 [Pseudobdellovibrionaceae bacterium]